MQVWPAREAGEMRFIILALFLSFPCWTCLGDNNEMTDYIVYMGARGEAEPHVLTASHHDILTHVLGSSEQAADSILFTYKHGFNGFSARLTHQHAATISRMPNIVSVFPSKKLNLQTTRSWDFLGLVQDVQNGHLAGPAGSYDPIIGVMDTGLWPESEAFNDDGLAPVPARWKGQCDNGGVTNNSQLFLCTKKIIGGRFYYPRGRTLSMKDFPSARDAVGHGTHTSSIAAGAPLRNVSVLGLAAGTARGGYPKARLASYKICWADIGCSEHALLAAFDDAIHDGVDILSLSIGPSGFESYDRDGLAIGSYHAVQKGITVSCSAGNFGPALILNVAPWILTVGASTIDRVLSSSIVLGNNVTLEGIALSLETENGKPNRLVAGGSIPSNKSTSFNASRCMDGSLDKMQLAGKIIVCIVEEDELDGMDEAAGVILVSDMRLDALSVVPMPSLAVTKAVGEQIFAYINSTREPTAIILKTSTVLGVQPSPTVGSFSSRGPNVISPDIIKPDVTAPGVNILAAWSPVSPIVDDGVQRIFGDYNIASGTSMSCPHVSGALAYLKSIHPGWSPAALKSALMTTASAKDNRQKPITDFDGNVATPFAYGSGQINPVKAADPGLVYDISPSEYMDHLCDSGYNASRLMLITESNSTVCSMLGANDENGPPYLNYPSFGFVNFTRGVRQKTRRTVTNVGTAASTYSSVVSPPSGVKIVVTPSVLNFKYTGQQLSFTVTVSTELVLSPSWLFGKLSWVEVGGGSHVVQSPVAVLVSC